MNTLFFSLFLGHPLFTSHSLFPISFLSPFLFPSHPISPSSLFLLLSSFYCLSLWNTPKRLNQLPIQNLPVYSTAYQNVTLDYVQFYGLVKSVITNSTWFFSVGGCMANASLCSNMVSPFFLWSLRLHNTHYIKIIPDNYKRDHINSHCLLIPHWQNGDFFRCYSKLMIFCWQGNAH